MKSRTKRFAFDAVTLCEGLTRSIPADVVSRQLVRSSTSVAANYRAACRARSTAECISKLGIVEEESDESGFWLEFAKDKGYTSPSLADPLILEASELTAIMVASIKKLRKSS